MVNGRQQGNGVLVALFFPASHKEGIVAIVTFNAPAWANYNVPTPSFCAGLLSRHAPNLNWSALLIQSSIEGEQTTIYPFEHRLEIQALTQAQKDLLLREVGVLYPTAKKNDGDDLRNSKVRIKHYPKRILDAWIRVLLPFDRFFADEMQQGRSTLRILQDYRDLIRQKVFSAQMQSMNYGFLNAEDLLQVASQMRQDLLLARGKMPKNTGAKIIFFGSANKGLEKPGSDYDAFWSTGSLPKNYFPIFERGLKSAMAKGGGVSPQVKGLAKIVNDMMTERHPGIEFLADHMAGMTNEMFAGSMTALEPFFIEANEDGVCLHIPSSEIQKVPTSGPVYIDSLPVTPRTDYRADFISESCELTDSHMAGRMSLSPLVPGQMNYFQRLTFTLSGQLPHKQGCVSKRQCRMMLTPCLK
jgi:hypothetical protein